MKQGYFIVSDGSMIPVTTIPDVDHPHADETILVGDGFESRISEVCSGLRLLGNPAVIKEDGGKKFIRIEKNLL